jgi:hypothetical protein
VNQDIVPQQLIDHFVSMTHPSQAEKTDYDIAHYCAFSLPAVALTLGRDNWVLLKDAHDTLASDMQVIIHNLHDAEVGGWVPDLKNVECDRQCIGWIVWILVTPYTTTASDLL